MDGRTPRELFFLVAHLIDVSLYLSNVTSIRWKSFPEARTAFTNLPPRSSNVLHSEGLPSPIRLDHLLLALNALGLEWPEDVPYHYSRLPSWPIYFRSWLLASKMARGNAVSSWLRIWGKSNLLPASCAVIIRWRVFWLSALMAAHFSVSFFLTS